ncbi:MAG: cyclic nucleotide-binding domain-containing protein [Acidimicrobiales bacterium]
MRIESSVTSISWIPSEAIEGATKLPFEAGIAHYDVPPPDAIEDLETLRLGDRFRFANELRAWIDVEDGKIMNHGCSGGGHIGSTTMRLGGKAMTFPAVPFPDIQAEPEVGPDYVRFVQTAGGRAGMPAPRRVNHPPFIQVAAPLAWTTLALTIRANGGAEFEVLGHSEFPRHWVYGHDGKLAAKSGIIDFDEWYRTAFGHHTPWGDEDSPAVVTAAETALERELSATIMQGGAKPTIRRIKQGEVLVRQGETGRDLYVLLDGVLVVDVDGQEVAEVGPGAILGERAIIEGGVRTSTLRARTAAKVAVAHGDQIDPAALAEISEGHRREEGERPAGG